MTFVTTKKPYVEGGGNNNNNTTTTTTITTNGTELDQNPKDYKNNHSSQCPE